jgi:hypothetical protein
MSVPSQCNQAKTQKRIFDKRTVKKVMEVEIKMALPGVHDPCVEGGSTGTENAHRQPEVSRFLFSMHIISDS